MDVDAAAATLVTTHTQRQHPEHEKVIPPFPCSLEDEFILLALAG